MRIKMCGLRRAEDVEAVNRLRPDDIGFVFAPASRRAVTPAEAARLRALLSPGIRAVGVFVDEDPDTVAGLLRDGVIDAAQLHGHEDAAYLAALRRRTDRPLIQAFRLRTPADTAAAMASPADLLLLDGGAGDGKRLEERLLAEANRPYYLAGGLTPENVADIVRRLRPWGVDVSSGIETDGFKDPVRMEAFMRAARAGTGGNE